MNLSSLLPGERCALNWILHLACLERCVISKPPWLLFLSEGSYESKCSGYSEDEHNSEEEDEPGAGFSGSRADFLGPVQLQLRFFFCLCSIKSNPLFEIKSSQIRSHFGATWLGRSQGSNMNMSGTFRYDNRMWRSIKSNKFECMQLNIYSLQRLLGQGGAWMNSWDKHAGMWKIFKQMTQHVRCEMKSGDEMKR